LALKGPGPLAGHRKAVHPSWEYPIDMAIGFYHHGSLVSAHFLIGLG
jgi:hypothetical protein